MFCEMDQCKWKAIYDYTGWSYWYFSELINRLHEKWKRWLNVNVLFCPITHPFAVHWWSPPETSRDCNHSAICPAGCPAPDAPSASHPPSWFWSSHQKDALGSPAERNIRSALSFQADWLVESHRTWKLNLGFIGTTIREVLIAFIVEGFYTEKQIITQKNTSYILQIQLHINTDTNVLCSKFQTKLIFKKHTSRNICMYHCKCTIPFFFFFF